jgi:SepF-like predicted cell division protein (DUF552 family)
VPTQGLEAFGHRQSSAVVTVGWAIAQVEAEGLTLLVTVHTVAIFRQHQNTVNKTFEHSAE